MTTIPSVDVQQMTEVDRIMIEDYHIELIQMMENAGRNLAHLARELFLQGNPQGKNVLVMAGSGGNGGGALVAARRLANWGASVVVALTKPATAMRTIPAHQLDILQRMKIAGTETIVNINQLAKQSQKQPFDVILDGIIGYNLNGNPYGLSAELIKCANQQPSPVLALDCPSGVDTTSGKVYHPAIRAAATLTLALPKKGLLLNEIQKQTGDLYLADISVPPELYASDSLGLTVDAIFARNEIVKIQVND
ncbi:MAG: NAD(P)H-hydrate epimerase [Alcanivoracaceae bacterium]|nr:NAD(P)H-hydrate epimerase [Alcanivoracaceae bacterium]